jgi:hypothetical protein
MPMSKRSGFDSQGSVRLVFLFVAAITYPIPDFKIRCSQESFPITAAHDNSTPIFTILLLQLGHTPWNTTTHTIKGTCIRSISNMVKWWDHGSLFSRLLQLPWRTNKDPILLALESFFGLFLVVVASSAMVENTRL